MKYKNSTAGISRLLPSHFDVCFSNSYPFLAYIAPLLTDTGSVICNIKRSEYIGIVRKADNPGRFVPVRTRKNLHDLRSIVEDDDCMA